MESLPIDDGRHMYLLWEEKDPGEYCLYTCDVGSCYQPVHEQEGRRLFGTKEEIIHVIETSAEK